MACWLRTSKVSNRDLEKAVREGHYPQDLYYRLAIIAIFIPPLGKPTEDILPLVEFFIDWYNRKFKKAIRGITPETRRLLLAHNWPGNVRELKNSIERAMILEDESILRPAYMPFAVGEAAVVDSPPSNTAAPPATAQANSSPMDAPCPDSIFRKKALLWKRLNARWWNSPCARPMAIKLTQRACSISAATPCAIN